MTKDKIDKNIIHCIGDSHVSFFSGWNKIAPVWPVPVKDRLPFFKSYHLGPALAYNLCEINSQSRGRENLFEVLKTIPPGEKVLLVFGEIDCRAHLLKQADRQNRDIPEVAQECVQRYFSAIEEVSKMGYEVMVWAAIPSFPCNYIDSEYPAYGSPKERNRATRLFNEEIERLCRNNGLRFISIFDQLLTKRGNTKIRYYMDFAHLSNKAMPLAIRKLQKELPKFNFKISFRSRFNYFFSKIKNMPTGARRALNKNINALKTWLNTR